MDGTKVGVLEKRSEVGLGRLLEGGDGVGLEAEVRLEVLGHLADEALEGQLADEELSALLVAPAGEVGDFPRLAANRRRVSGCAARLDSPVPPFATLRCISPAAARLRTSPTYELCVKGDTYGPLGRGDSPDLTEGNGSGPEAVGLLHAAGRGRGLARGLGGELLARGLPSGGLACGLLGARHCFQRRKFKPLRVKNKHGTNFLSVSQVSVLDPQKWIMRKCL